METASARTRARRDCCFRPQAVDHHVAARLRERRIALRLTQGQLAEMIGVTCQQMHKYERGVSRIGAGRLHALARALEVEVVYFFAGLEGNRPAAPFRGRQQMLAPARR